ncbi:MULTISPECIES: MarR family winged helix-turn-helix transcriptional regulator [Heyndrickxia]|uniref:MarR family winged helix-turn-helix transcriptional regulator n=1 Tax=Heyndrickxia TaxID=2837504 RepID=UPI001B1BB9E9|nr:MarR family transcriptional regulator [Heyndrickxia oleronia]GIN40680.1 MarR family transcriptional regulator [Heyndrickxia oleronia]
MKYEPLNNLGVFIHSVDLEITSFVNKKLADFQLTSEQNLIMAILWEQEGVSQNEIALRLNKDKSSVARMIVTLEKKGYIYRTICQKDRRSIEVFLTEKGKMLGKDVIPINQNIINTISKGMTDEEVTQLQRLLTKVRENVAEL